MHVFFYFFLTHLSSSVLKTRDLWRYVLLVFMGLQAEALQGTSEGEQERGEKKAGVHVRAKWELCPPSLRQRSHATAPTVHSRWQGLIGVQGYITCASFVQSREFACSPRLRGRSRVLWTLIIQH